MQLHIRHETLYRYATPAGGTVQTIRLTPRQDRMQRTLRWSLSTPGRRVEHRDPFGNLTHLVTIEEPLEEIRIVAQGVVEVAEEDGWLPPDEGGLSPLVFLGGTRLTRINEHIRHLAAPLEPNASPDDLLALAARILEAVPYVPGSTEVHHGAAEALRLGQGVCQDHTHLFLACCQARGVPARYVSGYVHTGAANVASHAWADAWLGESRGWFSLDVTNLKSATAHHCRLAIGRDYLDACPVRGIRRGGGEEAMSVQVFVGASADQ